MYMFAYAAEWWMCVHKLVYFLWCSTAYFAYFLPRVHLTKIFRWYVYTYISRCRFVNKAQSGSSDESMLARHESLSVPKVRASLSATFLFFALLYVVQRAIIVKHVAMKICFIFMNLSLDTTFHLINRDFNWWELSSSFDRTY